MAKRVGGVNGAAKGQPSGAQCRRMNPSLDD